jgi:hypothetical protein
VSDPSFFLLSWPISLTTMTHPSTQSINSWLESFFSIHVFSFLIDSTAEVVLCAQHESNTWKTNIQTNK